MPVIISGIADGITIQKIIFNREQPKIFPISTKESFTCVTPAWVSIITTQIENKITVAITVASAMPSMGISAGITAVIGAERKRLTQTDKILSARLLIPIKMPIGIPTIIDKESPIPKVLAVIINASQKADC